MGSMSQKISGADRLDSLLAQARLGGYLSGSCAKLRVNHFRVLAFGANLDGILYLDVYHASDDETQLAGMEFLISPSMEILRRVSYAGGFRPPSEVHITAQEVLSTILKPCRSQYLSAGRDLDEREIHGYRCRYRYEVTADDEHEIITLETAHGSEVIHEVRFIPHQDAR